MKIFKSILVAVAVFTSTVASGIECPKFNETQRTTLQKAYELGAPHDLGYTLATIAFKESEGGLHIINAITSDYGTFQGNVETICKQAGVFHKSFLCNTEIQRVVMDVNHAAKHAIETIQYWQNYHKKRSEPYLVYEKTIRSYNTGFSFDSGDATTYWTEYRDKFHILKRCIAFSEPAKA